MGSNTSSIIVMVVLLVVMYLLLIRPQNKKDKAEKEMRSKLQVGDEIMTVGGIYGKIVRIREDRITIASGAEKTKLEITKAAISTVITDKDKPGKAVEEDNKDAKSAVSPKTIKKLGFKKESKPEAEAKAEPETKAETETVAAEE